MKRLKYRPTLRRLSEMIKNKRSCTENCFCLQCYFYRPGYSEDRTSCDIMAKLIESDYLYLDLSQLTDLRDDMILELYKKEKLDEILK